MSKPRCSKMKEMPLLLLGAVLSSTLIVSLLALFYYTEAKERAKKLSIIEVKCQELHGKSAHIEYNEETDMYFCSMK